MNMILTFAKITGSPILHFLKLELLYSSILFLVIYMLSLVFAKKSPYMQIGLWTLLLIRLVLPPNLTSDYSLGSVIHSISTINKIDKQPVVFEQESPLLFINKNPVDTKNSEHIPSSLTNSVKLGLLCVWGCGVCLFFGIFLVRLDRYRRIVSNAENIRIPIYMELLHKWKRILKIKRSVRLITSNHIISPFTTGLFHPVIYLPQTLLESVQIEHLEPVIAHEMVHIKRYDSLWIKWQNVLQCVYFFHPVVWIANKKINQAREYICDGQVLMTKNIVREDYGKGLLNILKLNLPGTDCPAFIPGFKSPNETMKNRIKKIKGDQLMKKLHIIISFVFIFLAGMLLLPMAGKGAKNNSVKSGQPQQNSFVQLTEKFTQEMSSTTKIKFKKPLKEYVITAQYGAEFMFNNNFIKHNGIDLKEKRGTDIYASADGTVFKAVITYTKNKGYGKYIIIQHQDGFKTLYAHLDKIDVQEGQNVKTGQVIGQVGDTGQGTGSHLHFELIHQDEHKDPAEYIEF